MNTTSGVSIGPGATTLLVKRKPMDIEEIHIAKKQLEETISRAITEFQTQSQTTIERVELQHFFSDAVTQPERTSVSVKVSLGV